MPDLTDKALDALVKPLEWFEAQLPSRGGGKYTANGYTLRKIEGLWLLDFAGEGKTAWRWVDLDAAKAAAQADHTARSLSALNLDALTSLRGGAEAMRERAARIVLQCHAGEYWYRNHMAISPEMLAEAIRALPLPSDTDPGDFPGSHTSQPGEASVSSAPAQAKIMAAFWAGHRAGVRGDDVELAWLTQPDAAPDPVAEAARDASRVDLERVLSFCLSRGLVYFDRDMKLQFAQENRHE